MVKKVKKADRLKNVYLITGNDTRKVEAAARRLRERVAADDGTDLNIDIFDALDHGASEIVQAANTMPFGEGLRLVMVTSAGALKKADKEALKEFLDDPPEYTCLALVGGGIKKNETLYRAVEQAGQVLRFDVPRPSDLPAWTREQAAHRRLKLGPAESSRLAALAGNDTAAIITELEKLAAYAGPGKIGMEDIDAVCWVTAEVRIWDLTDALGARDREGVFRNLEALLAEHTAPAAIFYSLAKHLRHLAEIAGARERGENASQAAAALGLKPFSAGKIEKQSARFSAAGLRQAVRLMSELDADIKGRKDLRPDLVLEVAVGGVMDAVQ